MRSGSVAAPPVRRGVCDGARPRTRPVWIHISGTSEGIGMVSLPPAR